MAGEDNKSIEENSTTKHTNKHERGKMRRFLPQIISNYCEPSRTKMSFRTISSWCSCGWWLILLLLVSCQSLPKVPNINLETATSLPFENGAYTYVFADAKKARPIINLLPIEELNNKETRQLLDRTRFFAIALFPQGSGRRYQIVAQGSYPSSNAALAMSANKNWQKRRSGSGGKYWYSPDSGVSVLIGASHAYAAASYSSEPFEPFTPPPGVEVPKGFNDFRKGSPLSCWIASPLVLLNKMFAGLPVQSVLNLYFNLSPAPEGKYEAVIRLQFENTSHTKGMAVLITLASGFSSDPLLSAFLTNPPVVNGTALDIRSTPLGEKEIKALLKLLI